MTPQISLRWQLLALFLLVAYAIYLLAPVLTPFAVAATFAYLFDPIVDRMGRWKISRALATCIVFLGLTLLMVLVLVLLVPYLHRQISTAIQRLPDLVAWLQSNALPWINARFDVDVEAPDVQQVVGVLQEHWKEAGGIAATVIAQVSKSGLAFVAALLNFMIVPVAFFYLLRDWNGLIARIHDLLPRSVEPTVVRLAGEVDDTLSAFVRGQVSVMLALGVMYAVALWAVGIDIGPLIGIIAGLISFIPYLGSISGVLMGAIAAVVQYHDWTHLLLVLAVFATGNLIEGYVLVPRLVGDKIGLHPLAVIFSILAGGELFGFLGVLLALPVASVVMVLLRYANERYRASPLYGQSAAPAGLPTATDAPTVGRVPGDRG